MSETTACPRCDGQITWRSKSAWQMELGICRECQTIFVKVFKYGTYAISPELLAEVIAGAKAEEDEPSESIREQMNLKDPDALDIRLALYIAEASLEDDHEQ